MVDGNGNEVLAERMELAPVRPMHSPTLFNTDDPTVVIDRAQKVAKALGQIVESANLFKQIGAKKHLFVEAWTTCGSMVGVFPVCIWTRKLDNGWEARVEARTIHGAVVGSAEAQCTYDEGNWEEKDDFQLRSMAQTRATSKALAAPLRFIPVLAGFASTPAEEMNEKASKPQQQRRQTVPTPQRKPTIAVDPKSSAVSDGSEDRVPASVTDAAAPATSEVNNQQAESEGFEAVVLKAYSKEKVDKKGKANRGVLLVMGDNSEGWWNCYDAETIDNLPSMKGQALHAKLEDKNGFKLCHKLQVMA